MPLRESLLSVVCRRIVAVWLVTFLGPLATKVPLHAQSEFLPPPTQSSPAQVSADAEPVTPLSELVSEIRVIGNETIPLSQIENHITTRVGRPFNQSAVRRDVRQLANLGWFINVRPLVEKTTQGRIVIFEVVERPTIRYVTYLGNDQINDKKLAKETNLSAGGAVDPYAVQEGRRKLVEYYKGRGHNNVQVTILEGTKPTDKGIVYLINEGNFEKVWDVEFIGNEFAPDGRLKTLIQSKPPKFLILKGYMQRDEINADVDRLTAYYRSFGFFQARVSRKVEYYPGKKWVKLKFVIHEGLRYNIRDVRFLGNSKFEPVALADAGKIKPGDPFEQTKIAEDQRWIQELYGSRGYVFADIRPETVFLEEPGEVDLIYHIDEGEQFRIGNIYVNIGGDNPHTRIQTILNPMSIRPGDIADIREIRASERRIIARNITHSDPASGARSSLTYRISDESNQYELANRPQTRTRAASPSSSAPGQGSGSRGISPGGGGSGSRGFRGQSPDDRGPRVLAPPSSNKQQLEQRSPQPTPTVYRGQSPEQPSRPPVWYNRLRQARAQQTVRKPTNPYRNVRGQSPGSNVQQAYQGLPAGGIAQNQYGGQIVGATGPSANHAIAQAPVNQGAAPQGNIQQAQFSNNVAPPAGFAGPVPGTLPGYQIFPDGRFGAPGQPFPGQTVDLIFNGQETQTGRLMFGVGVNSDAGLVGNIVLDERNFDWRRPPRSLADIRNGTAWRGGGQRFRIDASPGSEVNRYLVSFQEPYLLDSPVSLTLSGSFFDRRFRDWDEERIGGRIGLGYQWVERDLSASFSYRGENVTISDALGAEEISSGIADDPGTPGVDESILPGNADLVEALGSNSLHGFRLTLINDTRDSAFLPTQGRYFEVSGEYVTGSFDYPRIELDFRRFFLLRQRPDRSGRHVLSLATNIGWLGEDAPIYEHFFAGGFSTLRGFDFRGASPVDAARNVEVGGEFQWLSSVQYLFPITADETLHGVVFCDFGTVESEVEINDFRVVPGVGLRVSVPALGPAPIALDFGFAINEADTDDTEVFSFSMGFGRN